MAKIDAENPNAYIRYQKMDGHYLQGDNGFNSKIYDDTYQNSIDDPEGFWGDKAQHVQWAKYP